MLAEGKAVPGNGGISSSNPETELLCYESRQGGSRTRGRSC